MRTWEQVRQLVEDVKAKQTNTVEAMRQVLNRYGGDWCIPVPEISNEPEMPQLTPQIIAQAVDFNGRRAASVMPILKVPAIRANQAQGTGSVEWAQKRRRAIGASYYESKYSLIRRRSMKHLVAYHTYAQTVIPDFKTGFPMIQCKDPLGSFVDPRSLEDLRPPEFFGFMTRHSGAQLRARFPIMRAEAGGPITAINEGEQWEMLEWQDHDQILFGLYGPVNDNGMHVNQAYNCGPSNMQIGPSIVNKAGMCCAIMPVNLSLGAVASGLANMIGSVDLQAKLTALDILAQQRAIFPDMYVLGREGSQPRLISGAWKPGTSGEVNLLQDVSAVGLLHMTPDQRTTQSIDRLERNVKTTLNLVPQASGETYGALRTGSAIDALGGMAVDPFIQELQELDAIWTAQLNRAILATYKGYFGGRKYTGFSGWPQDEGHMDFQPSKHVEALDNVVVYPIPGTDIVQNTQILGSMLGADVISPDTFRELHPWINDAENEARKLRIDKLSRATEQAMEQQLASGQLPLPLAHKIWTHLNKGDNIFEAVDAAQKELQAEQAAQMPTEPPEGMTAPPETMPGMAAGPAAMMPGGQPPAPPGGSPLEPQIQPMTQVSAMNDLMKQMAGKGVPGA